MSAILEARRCITNLRRLLERWELQHLRAHATEQQAQIEQLQADLAEARREIGHIESCAGFWNDEALRLQEAFRDENFSTHRSIGLTPSGELLVIRHDAPAAEQSSAH